MKLSDFDYNLPSELIAQKPIKPRDQSRLLILDKQTGDTKHKIFLNIIDYLKAGDVLVLNNSKVIPARLIGKKKETGGQIEIFLSKRNSSKGNQEIWQCMVKGKHVKEGLIVELDNDLRAKIINYDTGNTWLVEFNMAGQEFMKTIEIIGQTPLPPYIKKELTGDDKDDYQTVYAEDNKRGSVAAPTAGLHFTKKLLKKIKDKGVKIEYLTLHVGLGTFLPVKTNEVEEHQMHAEWTEVSQKTIKTIKSAKENNKKIVAVGTTACRSLEAVWQKNDLENNFADWVDIFIYPGYDFKIVNTLITNFHLPKSTLLMLVSALAGQENIVKAYQEAIEKKYRFYSYGDAMLII